MSLLKQKKLYRIKFIKSCPVIDLFSCTNKFLPSIDSFEKGSFGSIPIDTTGYIVSWLNKEFFVPDENQPGLDLFTSTGQPNVLISHKKIKGYYKKI